MIRFLAAALLGLSLVAAQPAAAQSLDQAKAAGQVGERPDGLVGVVADAPPAVRALVDQINARRLEEYRAIAGRNGTNVTAVQAIAGQKLTAQAPAGSFVMDASGKWVRK